MSNGAHRCCQTRSRDRRVDANTELIAAAITEAVGAGADIIVLPELATSGYMLADAEEARSVALTPDSPEFGQWVAAVDDSVAILGFCEIGDDGRLYNSAAVIDSGGVVAVYRKTHLWDREKLIFTPGCMAAAGAIDAPRCDRGDALLRPGIRRADPARGGRRCRADRRAGELAAVSAARG